MNKQFLSILLFPHSLTNDDRSLDLFVIIKVIPTMMCSLPEHAALFKAESGV